MQDNKQTIVDLETRFWQSMVDKDAKLAKTMIAEDCLITGPMGANHSDVVRNWALDGHGIVMLSSWDIAPELKEGALQRVLPGYSQVADLWAATAPMLSIRALDSDFCKRL